jgi:peptidoglycan/xylan/chitin deacetylase (PgdA/CDA1 family)
MQNRRYDYLPTIKRKDLQWPNGARVALWVCPNIEYFHIDKPIPNFGSPKLPDVRSYSLRDYGSRVGIFRLMDVLDKYGIRASVLLNAEVCEQYPAIIEEGVKRNWEWLGHGVTNNIPLNEYPLDEERQAIRQVKETIAAAVGTPPKGWLGPALAETFNTPDHLAAEGFEYLCDWGCDDQPVPMRVQSGRMIVVPYEQGLNDINMFLRSNHTPEEYFCLACDQFDILYREGEKSGRVMALPLHPFIIGIPYRIKYLDRVLEYICSHEKVWLTTGGEIASWYFEHYYEHPGQLDTSTR